MANEWELSLINFAENKLNVGFIIFKWFDKTETPKLCLVFVWIKGGMVPTVLGSSSVSDLE